MKHSLAGHLRRHAIAVGVRRIEAPKKGGMEPPNPELPKQPMECGGRALIPPANLRGCTPLLNSAVLHHFSHPCRVASGFSGARTCSPTSQSAFSARPCECPHGLVEAGFKRRGTGWWNWLRGHGRSLRPKGASANQPRARATANATLGNRAYPQFAV
jgi:hypothetical protein